MTHPNEKFLKLPDVIRAAGKCRSAIYLGVKNGTFPPPVKIGPRAVAWPSSSIAEWQQSCIAAAKSA